MGWIFITNGDNMWRRRGDVLGVRVRQRYGAPRRDDQKAGVSKPLKRHEAVGRVQRASWHREGVQVRLRFVHEPRLA